MWGLLIEGALLGLDLVYHRYLEDHPRPRRLLTELSIPRSDVGAPVPMIIGKTRVKAPILAWAGKPTSTINGGETFYGLDMLFVLGTPFPHDKGAVHSVHGMWAAERKLVWLDSNPGRMDGSGGIAQTPIEIDSGVAGGALYVSGLAQWFDGRPTQVFVDGSGAAQNLFATQMLGFDGADPDRIPGYRGVISIGLYNGGGTEAWHVGITPSVHAYSFEVSSYVSTFDASLWPAVGPAAVIGEDSNPMNGLYRLLTARDGLGLDPSSIDMDSFRAAANTLANEGHGYSRCIEDIRRAAEHMMEILEQIDAAMWEDPTTGKLGITLIRPDYDPAAIRKLTKANCTKFLPSLSGRRGTPNKFRLTFTDRADDYRDGFAEASNQASASDQGPIPFQLAYPGCCTQDLADKLVERENAVRSTPLMKAKAYVDRSFYRVKQGDPIMVTYENVSGQVFRVADVNRGTLENGQIELDLIQDPFYVWRQRPPVATGFGGHAVDVTSGLSGG